MRTICAKDINWADIIFVMEADQQTRLKQSFRSQLSQITVRCLDIPDDYEFMNPELVELLSDRINGHLHELMPDIEEDCKPTDD